MQAETHRTGSTMPDSPSIVFDGETLDGPLGHVVGGGGRGWTSGLIAGAITLVVMWVGTIGFTAWAANPVAAVVIGLVVGAFFGWTIWATLRAPGIGVAGRLAAGWLALVIGLAILAPALESANIIVPPNEAFQKGLPIGSEGHPLGTDKSRRDVLSRLIWGARGSLVVGFGAVSLGMIIGGTLGLISGFRRGRADTALSSLFDVLLAFPQLVLALSLVAFLKPPPPAPGADGQVVEASGGLTAIQILILAIGIVAIPLLARITRATTLTWSQREFVLAGRAQGARGLRLMIREVLPNVLPAMFSVALLSVGVAIIAEGGLSVLGVGVEPPQPSWGNMIAEHRSVNTDPLNALFVPMVVVFLTIMALNYLGDAVREIFDVRESAL